MTDLKSQISGLSATELARAFRTRQLSPVEAARDALARIERFEPAVNAFMLVDGEGAVASARASEARWGKGEPQGLLDGVPATIKDNVWLKGLPSRRGSLTADSTPMAADAPAVARMREHGA